MPASLQRVIYWSLAELFPIASIVSGRSGNDASVTFDGIEPPAAIPLKDWRMTCPDGRTVPRNPFRLSRIISLLYSFRTFQLLAFGQGVLESHQTYSTESLILIRRTVTHSAGIGILAGLYQKHSCAKWNPRSSTSATRSLKW